MKRNVRTEAEKGRKIIRLFEKRDLSCSELMQLFSMKGGNDNQWDMVCTAFYFGVAVGNGCNNQK